MFPFSPTVCCSRIMDWRITREDGKQEGSSFYHIGDGYYYHFHRETGSTIYFRCGKSSCWGRAIFKLGHRLQHTQPHNHAPDVLYTEVLAHRRAVLNASRSMTYVSFSEIIRAEKRRSGTITLNYIQCVFVFLYSYLICVDIFYCRVLNPEVSSMLTLRRLRSAMQRARSDIFPPIPENLAGLSLVLEDPQWRNIASTPDFHDSIYLGSIVAVDYSHSVVFMSSRCLNLLSTAAIVFADGTFFITPSVDGCYQVKSLH